MTYDADTSVGCRDLFVQPADAEGIARIQVDLIAEQIGDAGQVAILSATANATNQNAWIELMKTELADNHPDIELVDVVYGDDDDQTSFDKTAALLQTYPDLKGIISPTTVGISAAARYLQTSEYKGTVQLTGLGTPNQMRDFVEDGTVTAFALWNPGDAGYLAAYAAKALIEGTITGAEGDEFDAGTPRLVHGRQGQRRAARRPVHLQQGQHRRLRLLGSRRAGPVSGPGPHPPPKGSRCSASASNCRSIPPGSTSTWSATARSGRACWPRSPHPGAATTRSSSAPTACSSATSRSTTWRHPPPTSPPRRSPPSGKPRSAGFFTQLDGRPDQGFVELREVFHLD